MKRNLLLFMSVVLMLMSLNANTELPKAEDQPPVPPAPPADLFLSCANDIPDPVKLTAKDDIDGEITVSPTAILRPGTCVNDFVYVRTWTFTDSGGNTVSVSQTITVFDDQPPVIQGDLPQDMVLSCAKDLPDAVALTAVDNCGQSWTRSPTATIRPGRCINDFEMVRTWTFVDTCGNSTTHTQTITVFDNEPPVIQGDLPQDMVLSCAKDLPDAVALTAVDNCGQSWTRSPTATIRPGRCINDFEMVRTWTFVDTCGNSTTHTQTIIVLDDEPPVIQGDLPPDLVLSCAKDLPDAVALTAVDNCGQSWTRSPTTTIRPGVCINDFEMVRTWIFVDTCGNSTTHTQTIEVLDNEPPVIQGDLPQDIVLSCSADIPSAVALTAVDNCGQSWTRPPTTQVTPGTCLNELNLVRTWIFVDTCGNTTTHTQTIEVLDNEPPVIQGDLPQDMVLSCAKELPDAVALTAVDNCGQSWTRPPTTQVTPGTCLNELNLVRTWIFVDTCGNTTTHTQTIEVLDNEPPVIQGDLPQDMVLSCSADIPSAVALTAVDNCGQSWTRPPTTQVTPGTCLNELNLVRTWIFVDTCGNTTTHTQTINVLDDEPPVFIDPPGDLVLECDEEVPVAHNLTAIDNCDRDRIVVPVEEIIPGVCENAYTIIRTWTVEDTCDNVAIYTQTIEVGDNTPPVITCPPDETVSCNNIPSVYDAGYYATATDNCDDDVFMVYDGEVREDFCEDGYYVLTRSWTATDNCGNIASCEQLITVITEVETECWILRLVAANYDEGKDVSNYVWKLFSKGGPDCKYALSNIIFELPDGVVASAPADNSIYVTQQNKYLVENPVSPKNKNSNLYGIKFEVIGDGAQIEDAETFKYTLPGENLMSDVTVKIKAGNSTQTAVVDLDCACSYSSLKSGSIIAGDFQDLDKTLKVYPNPTSGKVRLEIENFINPDVTVRIMNITGQKVFEHNYNATGLIELDLTKNITGIYFINVIVDEESFVRRIDYIEK